LTASGSRLEGGSSALESRRDAVCWGPVLETARRPQAQARVERRARQAPRRAEANASHPAARREEGTWPGRSRGPSAGVGSRPYSPRVAKSIARSAAFTRRRPSACRLSNMAARVGMGADVRSHLQRNLQAHA
jgi:hypothetical protein